MTPVKSLLLMATFALMTSFLSPNATTQASALTATKSVSWEALIEALHQVETGGRLGPIKGDGGQALGPLQIHRAYHKDSGVPGSYEQCADLDYSVRVVRNYMQRYATESRLGRPVTAQDIARIHNGGPNGWKRKSTLGYWAKVRKELVK
jgi:hypothetical protein